MSTPTQLEPHVEIEVREQLPCLGPNLTFGGFAAELPTQILLGLRTRVFFEGLGFALSWLQTFLP